MYLEKAMKNSIITDCCFIKKLKRSMKLRPNPANLCRISYSSIVEEERVQTELVATLYEDKTDTGKVGRLES